MQLEIFKTSLHDFLEHLFFCDVLYTANDQALMEIVNSQGDGVNFDSRGVPLYSNATMLIAHPGGECFAPIHASHGCCKFESPSLMTFRQF